MTGREMPSKSYCRRHFHGRPGFFIAASSPENRAISSNGTHAGARRGISVGIHGMATIRRNHRPIFDLIVLMAALLSPPCRTRRR